MNKEASEEKVKLAIYTCLSITQKQTLTDDKCKSFVSYILDAIELTGDDEPFTRQQQDKIITIVKLLKK